MSQPVPLSFNRFLLGLSCCALASIAAQAKEPLLPLAEEVTQLKAKIRKFNNWTYPNADLPLDWNMPDAALDK